MSERKWQPAVVIGSGPGLARVARTFGAGVRCVDVANLERLYDAAVVREVVVHIAASVTRPDRRRRAALRRSRRARR
jgi:hypothetical protein